MRSVILCPRRGGGLRDEIWTRAIYPNLVETGLDVFYADSDTEVFNISQAWNNASALAGEWDIAFLNQADRWVSPVSILMAVDLAIMAGPMVYAADRVIRLNERGTHSFISGKRDGWTVDELRNNQLPYPLRGGARYFESPRAITRQAWDELGGFADALDGWGSEDILFNVRVEMLMGAPMARAQGVEIDCWHPKHGNAPDDPFYANWKANRQQFLDFVGDMDLEPVEYVSREEALRHG